MLRVRRQLPALAMAAAIISSGLAAGTAAAGSPAGAGSQVVAGSAFDPTALRPSHARPADRERSRRIAMTSRPASHGRGATVTTASAAAATTTVAADLHAYLRSSGGSLA